MAGLILRDEPLSDFLYFFLRARQIDGLPDPE